MTIVDSTLDFSVLLVRVLGYWPEFVDVAQLRLDEGRPDFYVVIGLGDLGDSIAEELNGEIDAVLVTALCDALVSTIRSAALFCMKINPALLRPSMVRDNFEKRLRRAENNPDLGWSEDDILLIKRYFSVNP